MAWKSEAAYRTCRESRERAIQDRVRSGSGTLEITQAPGCDGAMIAALHQNMAVEVLPRLDRCGESLVPVRFEGARGTDGWRRDYDVCVEPDELSSTPSVVSQGRWILLTRVVDPSSQESFWRRITDHGTLLDCERRRAAIIDKLQQDGQSAAVDAVERERCVCKSRGDGE